MCRKSLRTILENKRQRLKPRCYKPVNVECSRCTQTNDLSLIMCDSRPVENNHYCSSDWFELAGDRQMVRQITCQAFFLKYLLFFQTVYRWFCVTNNIIIILAVFCCSCLTCLKQFATVKSRRRTYLQKSIKLMR